MTTFHFGPPWQVPAGETAVQVEAPIGQPCLFCKHDIVEGEQGLMTSFADLDEHGEPRGSVRPAHRWCWLRIVLGPVGHLDGSGCPQCRGDAQPGAPEHGLWEEAQHLREYIERRGGQ